MDYDTVHADLYVRATPTACVTYMTAVATHFAASGWAKVDGSVISMPAGYDGGGNHHNEMLWFELGGVLYAIWHSSIGFGWRACAPPDCLLVCSPGTTMATCDYLGGFAVNGCTRVQYGPPPPIPVICAPVNADGSVPPLLDPWQAHIEDTDYPLLPCPGDMTQ